jgi:glycolate oxidase FAD binding subunit
VSDQGDSIAARVAAARERGEALYLQGGNTKRHLLGREPAGTPLDLSGHRGIVDYQPAELVMTARAGTPLAEIRDALAGHRQQMSFEPPLFDGRATLGGTLACNLSGPARPWCGSIRDMVLGIKLVNGKAETLSFGGQVMKNVAGYDVSRLQAGALGTLGVITEVSFKVLPEPDEQLTLAYEMNAAEAVQTMNQRGGEPRPLTGALWVDGQLYLRVAGTPGAVRKTASDWGGDTLAKGEQPWEQLREMRLPFFTGSGELWRLSLDSTARVDTPPDRTLIDWGGAQRWLRDDADRDALRRTALSAGGHACLFRGGDRQGEVRQPLEPAEQQLQQRLKQAFDPDRILNPGRLYGWL